MTLNLSLLYFINTNLQFWMSDYLVEINKVPYRTIVIAFATICITAPVGGAICSGFIGTRLGGYESNRTFVFIVVTYFFLAAIAVPVPFVPSTIGVLVMIWLLFFLGGVTVPMNTGIMLSLVEPEYRPQATAFANTLYTAIGYFPAPFIYGLIQ